MQWWWMDQHCCRRAKEGCLQVVNSMQQIKTTDARQARSFGLSDKVFLLTKLKRKLRPEIPQPCCCWAPAPTAAPPTTAKSATTPAQAPSPTQPTPRKAGPAVAGAVSRFAADCRRTTRCPQRAWLQALPLDNAATPFRWLAAGAALRPTKMVSGPPPSPTIDAAVDHTRSMRASCLPPPPPPPPPPAIAMVTGTPAVCVRSVRAPPPP